MDRRTKVTLALLFVALFAVAGGLWRRYRTVSGTNEPTQSVQAGYRVLTSGVVEAAEVQRALVAEASAIPGEVEAAQTKSRASHQPLIDQAVAPGTEVAQEETPAQVPPSQQVLIAFSGGVIGETDPCG